MLSFEAIMFCTWLLCFHSIAKRSLVVRVFHLISDVPAILQQGYDSANLLWNTCWIQCILLT